MLQSAMTPMREPAQATAISQSGRCGSGRNGRESSDKYGATAIGVGAQAGATAPGEINATAVGNGALANAANATALGQGSTASDTGSTALGTNAQATGTNAIATGGAGNVVNAPTASGAQSIAIGFLSSSTSQFATSLGTQSAAPGLCGERDRQRYNCDRRWRNGARHDERPGSIYQRGWRE